MEKFIHDTVLTLFNINVIIINLRLIKDIQRIK